MPGSGTPPFFLAFENSDVDEYNAEDVILSLTQGRDQNYDFPREAQPPGGA